MKTTSTPIKNINEYICLFPAPVQKKLKELCKVIRATAPKAEEKISYNMPTFYLNGNLVHFAAYKYHIGFYPAPSGIKAFEKELAKYTYAKGSVQFPLDKPIPIALVKKIVAYRVKENLQK